MLLSDVFDTRAIRINLESRNKEDAFKELVDALAVIHGEFNRDAMLAAIQEREDKMNTSIAPGVAVPHGYYPGTSSIVGALGISTDGIDYGAPDKKPVYCIFAVVMGEASHENHLHILSRIMTFVTSGGISLLLKAKSPDEIHTILSHVR